MRERVELGEDTHGYTSILTLSWLRINIQCFLVMTVVAAVSGVGLQRYMVTAGLC